MTKKRFAIIEIGSNNTKTHIYEDGKLIFENTTTIELKKNYFKENRIDKGDIAKLYKVLDMAKEYTSQLHIYGTSVFRKLSEQELKEFNADLKNKYLVEIEVVSQEDEAHYTALGCYGNIDYDGNICVFIGGGGSIELIFVTNHKVIDKKYYNFGVVDVTSKFESLKNDIPDCTFDEVYNYVDNLVGEIDFKTDVLILAGGDHLYWYNTAKYDLIENELYYNEKQKFMLTSEMNDKYDRDALSCSLEKIRQNSDNPKWFDGSRAMKVITNLISHKVGAKFIIPTKINMEDGLKNNLGI